MNIALLTCHHACLRNNISVDVIVIIGNRPKSPLEHGTAEKMEDE